MTLPAEAQGHLLTAFQAHIAGDAVIPADARYRMYAEKVVRHPLSEWQGLTVEEARAVFKRLASEPMLVTSEPPPWIAAGPEPVSAACLAVLARVDRRQPLNRDDHAEVLVLIRAELLHVTPEFDRTDKCPYRLTAAGQDALRQGQAA